MIIPIASLEADTLHSIAESFVLREGTDYGEIEASFEEKVAQVVASRCILQRTRWLPWQHLPGNRPAPLGQPQRLRF